MNDQVIDVFKEIVEKLAELVKAQNELVKGQDAILSSIVDHEETQSRICHVIADVRNELEEINENGMYVNTQM